MKIDRERILATALSQLDRVGLEGLTLRLLATELGVKAATLYWHFSSKEALIDALATRVLAEGADGLLPADSPTDWRTWARTYGEGLRKLLVAHRDGARMVSGTRLTDTTYLQTLEHITGQLVRAGFTLRQAVVLLGTVYSYTAGFVIEEQAIYPQPGLRNPSYDLDARATRLQDAGLPLLAEAGPVLLDNFTQRYTEGLNLILAGTANP